MLYLAIGVAGFAAVAFYDLAQLRGKRGIATLLSSIGYLCIVASIVSLLLSVGPPNRPLDVLALELLVTALSFFLLVYSVLIEIPLARRRRPASPRSEVISDGFYGMVRHPGFLWFVLVWASITLIYYQDAVVARVGLCLIVLDFALVLLEDAVFFPRIFAGYDDYKRRVPFLIPRLRRKTDDVHL